jgi:hypothetical protein
VNTPPVPVLALARRGIQLGCNSTVYGALVAADTLEDPQRLAAVRAFSVTHAVASHNARPTRPGHRVIEPADVSVAILTGDELAEVVDEMLTSPGDHPASRWPHFMGAVLAYHEGTPCEHAERPHPHLE